MVAEWMRDRLSQASRVVGVANTGKDLLTLLGHTNADCLLLDISLPDRNGLDLLPDIRHLQPSLKILVVTMHLDRYLAAACLASGAHGYLPKNASQQELLYALARVLAGHQYVSSLVPKNSQRVGPAARHTATSGLSQISV
jgi:DNA-binding NarL/FixJ family response regulator